MADIISVDSLTKVRVGLLLDNPFIGTLATSLGLEFDNSQTTAYTNGQKVAVNKEFYESLTHKERTGVMAHEIFHVMLLHHIRRMPWMDPKVYQCAIDIIVNALCLEHRFEIPKDGILPTNWVGGVEEYFKISKMSVEHAVRYLGWEYDPEHLPDPSETSTGECNPPRPGGDQKGNQQDDPSENPDKEKLDGQRQPTSQEISQEENRVKKMLAQAYQNARQQGDMSHVVTLRHVCV